MYKFPKKWLLAIVINLFAFPMPIHASENCFIAQENGKIVKQIGQCDKRYSPFSTFKIPLALIGFDSGILISPKAPLIHFTPEIEKQYVTYYNPQKYPMMLLWKKAQTPKSWIQNSVVWYSRYITHQLGMQKFQKYVKQFHYGNQNVQGELHKDDGLMNAWLNSSLRISPIEQVKFLEKLSAYKLPVSKISQINTIEIMRLEILPEGWQLYGKTGGAVKFGWFVGWVEKGKKRILFAQYIEQSEDAMISGGRMAKEVAKDNLISLIDD